MSKFTQLGISGKTENVSEKKTIVTENANHRVEKQAVSVFAGALIFTGLAGGLLLETSGCSRSQSKSDIQAPTPVQSVQQSVPLPATTSTAAVAANEKPVVKKVIKPRKPSSVLYSDQASGVSFLYPKKYPLKSLDNTKADGANQETANQKTDKQDTALSPLDMNFVQPGGVSLASVTLPKGAYPGTDLASASFNVSVNKNLTAEQCSQFTLLQLASTDDLAVQPTRLKFGTNEFQEMEAISGSDKQQSDAKYFHRFENGTCYEFSLGLSTQAGKDDDEVVPVDRQDVFRRLERILATVKITPTASAEPAVTTTTGAVPAATAPSTQDVAAK